MLHAVPTYPGDWRRNLCAEPGCKNLVKFGVTFCVVHRVQGRKQAKEQAKEKVREDLANRHVLLDCRLSSEQQPLDGYRNIGREKELLQVNLLRAKNAELLATLTLDQWLFTLEYFHWRCAYCGIREYTVIEHFIPISQGGGTTKDNCVPACQGCNSRKKGCHPLSESFLFNRDDIKRVQQFLEDVREKPVIQILLPI